jgi:putative transcriptional regulator
MSPRRHPSQALLVDYAAGGLEAGRALVIGAHVGACPECRQEVHLAERVGGALLDDLPPAAMAPDALAKALARIERPAPEPPPAPPPPPDWIVVPPDVVVAARRRRWAAPGVWVAHVTRARDGKMSYLLGVAAGMAVPLHSHRGLELVCVVKGAYKDRGHIHRPGDLAENDDDVEHQPRVTRDGECVCLISADAPLLPRNWIGRLFQPLVGI